MTYKKRASKLTISQENEVVDLYQNKNMSTRAIAKLFPVSSATICLIIKKHGIKPTKKGGRPKMLTDAQCQEIVKLYNDKNLSTYKIGQQFNCCAETIANVLRNANQSLKIIGMWQEDTTALRAHGESKKLLVKFTFREMTKEKAFLLGLIYGDGSISIRKDYINITSGDIDLLTKAQEIFYPEPPIKFKIKKAKDQNCWRAAIYSHKLCDELLELFQLTNNKSDKLIFPNLDHELMPFFISGYLATDGCIYITKKTNSLNIGFYSCSKQHLNDLGCFLSDKTSVPLHSAYERKNIRGHLGKKPLYILAYSWRQAETVCEYIFRNTSEKTRSDRKFSIYTNFMRNKYGIVSSNSI
jgi:transposase